MTIIDLSANLNSAVYAPPEGGTTPQTDPSVLGVVPAWFKVGNALPYTAFQAAALTKIVTLFTLLAGARCEAVQAKHSQAFAGVGLSSVAMQIGVAGGDELLTAFDVMQAVTTSALSNGNMGIYAPGPATVITIKATAVGANLSVLTAGMIDVYALLSKI